MTTRSSCSHVPVGRRSRGVGLCAVPPPPEQAPQAVERRRADRAGIVEKPVVSGSALGATITFGIGRVGSVGGSAHLVVGEHSASSMRVGVTSATIPGIPSRVKCRGDQSQHWARTLGETTPPSEQVEDDKPTHHAHHASARSLARAHEAGRPRFAAPGSGRRAGTSAAARPARPPASCAGASPSDRTEPTTRPCLGNPSPGYCARSPVLLARAMSQTPATTTRPTAQAA